MTPRNTNTGGVLEAMILPALKRGHYTCQTQVKAGTRCGGGTHKADALAQKDGAKVLVSLKCREGKLSTGYRYRCRVPISFSVATAGRCVTTSRQVRSQSI